MTKIARRTLLPLVLAGCGTTALPLVYAPQTAPRAGGPAVVRVGTVAVERKAGSDDPLWLGTIRGGYGNPLKNLNADVPVDRVVARAFEAGLAQRGLNAAAAPGRYRLDLVVTELDANQYARREATAAFRGTLIENASGRTAWTDTARAYKVEGNLITLSAGAFGSIEELHGTMTRVLGEAVDRMLDAPAFRAAVT